MKVRATTDETIVLQNWVPVADLAKSVGVHVNAVHNWLNGPRRPRVAIIGKRAYVHADTAKIYLDTPLPRVPQRPKGWLSTKKACSVIGYTYRPTDYLLRHAKKKKLRGVRVGRCYFWHPDDCERLRLEFGNLRPLTGWVSSRKLANKCNVTTKAIRLYAKKNNLRCRYYTENKIKTAHFLESDFANYLEKRKPNGNPHR